MAQSGISLPINGMLTSAKMLNWYFIDFLTNNIENDDFMIDKSITEVINFLDNNPEYVSARG